MSKVIIIGAGAAGMMAGIIAARKQHDVTIFEKNEKAGKKLYITGKGRCNLTNACDDTDLRESIVSNQKFMYSAFSRFSNYDCMGFFDELGLKFKVERGDRVFPESDRAADVIDCLKRELRRLHVNIEYNACVTDIIAAEENADAPVRRCSGIRARIGNKTQTFNCDELIIATGGRSYPSTGSTGDGYESQ